jgi:hypothetical protein
MIPNQLVPLFFFFLLAMIFSSCNGSIGQYLAVKTLPEDHHVEVTDMIFTGEGYHLPHSLLFGFEVYGFRKGSTFLILRCHPVLLLLGVFALIILQK